ncbi:MAG: tetratricopeptide repeat protein [Gammaproteobacteria bacterium]|nr:tetratricopeptide repeat protein [Gammaproteobacteria bacterium]
MSLIKQSVLQMCQTASVIIFCLTSNAASAGTEYIGRDACVECHAAQVKLWQGSHHALAMQHANDDTVLADFNNIEFTYAGISSRFYKKKEKFIVRTDGPDGKLRDYEIKYTFGVAPLQQYLVELDKGRLQALTVAWDTRDKKSGGQRWYHLYPDEEITHTDELHWTRTNFNWNSMCAECHSTNLKKNYDSASDTFKTSWSEIDVSCEACHGPAAKHITWARKQTGWEAFNKNKGLPVLFDERRDVVWKKNSKNGNAQRSIARTSDKEIQVCAQCHSRRSVISADYSPGRPFMDHYMPRLLDQGMYFADGQIQDEVYVYGSFLQSKMYQVGVTCSDCHEPHSLQLRHQGNGVCLQCHAAGKFDNEKHHFHKAGTEGAQCAECHMPARNYMVVDPRHDHSFRIPRPDLSVNLGTPNACNHCHTDKDAAWAAAQAKKWYGRSPIGHQQFANALDAGRKGDTRAGRLLVEQVNKIDTPDIARASTIGLMPRYLDRSNLNVIQQGLTDENAMVRRASVGALEGLQPAMLVQLVFPLLDDPVRSVRIEAARVLAPVPVGELQGKQLSIYRKAADEYIASQTVNAERPEAQLNLANYYVASGKGRKAEAALKKAIELEEVFMPAYINLADIYRIQGKDAEAYGVLLEARQLAPDNADVRHALGLVLVRQNKSKQAVEELEAAARLAKDNARYVYVYAVALNSTGKPKEAIAQLQIAHDRFPHNVEVLQALVSFNRNAGNAFAAERYMKKLKNME